MSFLEYAVWGSYLTSLGVFLASIGLGGRIGWFFAAQGAISLFMPALVGSVADRWIQPQRLLGACHVISALFMTVLGITALGGCHDFLPLFVLYCLGIGFFMPTISLSKSVIFTLLARNGMDSVEYFPPIRTWGTVGFVFSMWIVNFLGIKTSGFQFIQTAVMSLLLCGWTFVLPECPVVRERAVSLSRKLGFGAFSLLRRKEMATYFLFSTLISVCLQVKNAYDSPYMESFRTIPEFADSVLIKNSMLLLSVAQIAEACCFLLVPFFMKRYGIKRVVLIAVAAWCLRFTFLGLGDPGAHWWLLGLSMLVYGIAFDFFNVAGSIFVEKNTDASSKAGAQGLLMMFNNGLGTILGMTTLQAVLNRFTQSVNVDGVFYKTGNWTGFWITCAIYALTIGVLFAIFFRYKDKKTE